MALVRTDYGLIYNTDGSLCATLLPEGGVAVTEGTTNLCDPAYMYTNTWTTIDYAWGRRTIIDCTVGDVFTISADIRNLSQGEDRRWVQVAFHDSGGIRLEFYNGRGSGMSEQRLSFTTPPAPMGTVEVRVYWASDTDGVTYQGKNFQIEKKPYATPFVEGTRPAGILSYPELAKQFNQHEFTFAAWWKPYTEYGISSSVYDRFFHLDSGAVAYGNNIRLVRSYGTQGLTLTIPDGNGIGDKYYTFTPSTYEAHKWHFIACVLDVKSMKCRIHLNNEYQEFNISEIPAIFDAQRFFLGCRGTSGQLNGELKNVRICPYAVSPETVATWHSLDAPFYDPREQIDAGARPIYAPGTTIGAKGLVVDKNGVDQVAVGDISGREWKGSPLPSGTFGLWAPDGFIAVSDVVSTEITDYSGISYIGNGMYYETVPGFEVSITVPIGTKLLIYLSAEFYYEFLPSYYGVKSVDFRLLLNDQTIIGTERRFSDFAPEGMYQWWQTHRNLSITTIQEATNEFNKVNLQWKTTEREKVTLSNRILGILAIRR